MLAPNHIIGGLAFTGTFAAIYGENIMASPWAIGVCVLGSLAPDCDNPKAPAGLLIYPIAKWISKNYAHRTITHSLLVLCASTLLFYNCHPLIWFLSFLSHLILDMMTRMGVPLLYPFYKNKCVFGKPEMRFYTGDLRFEGAYFIGFALILLSAQNLMNDGFWTTYNRQFGTQKHLFSEFQKSPDLLQANYEYMNGSELIKGTGYVIEAEEKKTKILRGTDWLILDGEHTNIKQITFTHTGKKFAIQNQSFIQISLDSLNTLVAQKSITEAEILSSTTAKVSENGILKDFKTYKGYHVSNLLFYSKDTSISEKPFFNLASNTAKLKRMQIQTIREEYELKKQKWDVSRAELTRLITDTTSNYIARENNMKRIADLKNDKVPELDEIKIKQIEYEALLSEQQESERTAIEFQKYKLDLQEKKSGLLKTSFSGYIKYPLFQ